MDKDNILMDQFEKETGIPVYNSQEEIDIEYVWWLEEKIIALEQEKDNVR